MENKVKAGDVWWNSTDDYGVIFLQPESGMDTIMRKYLFHNKLGASSKNYTWEAGGLESTAIVVSNKFKFLYNIHDVITLSIGALNEEHST